METINKPAVEQDTVVDRREIVLPADRESAPRVESRDGVTVTVGGRRVEAHHGRGSIDTGEPREMPATNRALSGAALRGVVVEPVYMGHATSSRPAQPIDM